MISDLNVLEKEIVVITGIGNPERFFRQLSAAGLKFKKIIFNDHHLFIESDFKDYDDMNIIMTEKDAVKCKNFAKENFWYLPIYADVEEGLLKKMMKKLRIN
jgi:tetraacyldisaccharide 4'-kinase